MIQKIKGTMDILPNETHQMCYEYFEGNCQKAMEMQIKYSGLIEALFCDVNPIPVKEAMNMLGWKVGRCRMPLGQMSDAAKATLYNALKKHDLVK